MTFNLIYYKSIIDNAIGQFVSCFENAFRKDGSKYVLSLSTTKHKLYSMLCQCIDNTIDKALSQKKKKDICIVIGSCYPKDNLLLEYKDSDYFPKKLEVLLHNRPALKWLMRETDIEIDIDLFNEVFM